MGGHRQVLEEDASVVNPMISSAVCCVHGVRELPGYSKLGELASMMASRHSFLCTTKRHSAAEAPSESPRRGRICG